MPLCDTVTVRAGGVLYVHDTHQQTQRSSESGSRQPCKPHGHVQVTKTAFLRLASCNADACDSHQTYGRTDCDLHSSVWKSPPKQWSSKGRERLESVSTNSSGRADREGGRSREGDRDVITALQWPSQTDQIGQKGPTGQEVASPNSDSARVQSSLNEPAGYHSSDAGGGSGSRQQHLGLSSPQAALEEAVQRQQKLYDEQMHRKSMGSQTNSSSAGAWQESASSSGRGGLWYTVSRNEIQKPAGASNSEQGRWGADGSFPALEKSPPPLEISQAPRGQNEELATRERSMPRDTGISSQVEVVAIGLVICNKQISVVSSSGNGSTPCGGSSAEATSHRVTLDLVQVQRILPNSPASRCEAIAVGDEILAVNSFSCRGRSCHEVVSYMTPMNTHLAGQHVKPVHIISRRCSSTRSLRPRETLCHTSIVASSEKFSSHANTVSDFLPAMQKENDVNAGLSASLSAVEEALSGKMLTPRDGPAPRSLLPGLRKSVYDTTWRTFPLISLFVSAGWVFFIVQWSGLHCKT